MTSLRAVTGVLQDSVEELVLPVAMEMVGVDSSEAVGSKDKLGVDGPGESEDSEVVCSDDVDGPSLGWVANGRELGTVLSVGAKAGADGRDEDATSES